MTVLGFRQVFDESILLLIFLHGEFHAGVRQIIPKLILHKILDVYPRVNFMYKGVSIVQKLYI